MSVEQQEKGQEKGQAGGQSGVLTGKTFGGYRIGETLSPSGSSSASTVYLAEPTAGGDKVVLRVFNVDLAKDKNLSARLVADVQKACAVSHPNLVPVREIGTADHKGKRHLYVATERLEGESLKSRLAQKGGSPVELAKALHIASEVGAALQAIHRANGTHRQVGLGSVFIARGGDQEKIYLLDLGSALVPASEGAGDKGGKAGKGGKIQDDIRSLAYLVQEMLGGVATGDGAGAQAVLPLRLRNPKVPARLDAVLRTALGDTLGAADRSSRFDSVAGFVAALFGTGETQPSYMAWSEDGRTAPRPRAQVSPGLLWAAGAIAVVIGILVVAWFYSQDSSTTPVAADLAPAVVTTPTPNPAPGSDTKSGPTPSAAPDAGAPAARPGPWPPRTGVIPPLRDADPAPPPPAAAPPAAGATPPAVRAPAPTPVPAPGAGAGAPPATGAAPPAVRAPAPAPAGGAGAGPQSAPAAPKTPPAAKPTAPPQGPGAPAPSPGPSGQKEVK